MLLIVLVVFSHKKFYNPFQGNPISVLQDSNYHPKKHINKFYLNVICYIGSVRNGHGNILTFISTVWARVTSSQALDLCSTWTSCQAVCLLEAFQMLTQVWQRKFETEIYQTWYRSVEKSELSEIVLCILS